MRILDQVVSHQFDSLADNHCCVGLVTGPIRIICALAQIVINFIGLLLSPFTYPCREPNSLWTPSITGIDFLHGIGQVAWGVFDMVPGSSCLCPCVR